VEPKKAPHQSSVLFLDSDVLVVGILGIVAGIAFSGSGIVGVIAGIAVAVVYARYKTPVKRLKK
jgi:hypothetical protein